jgi:hypothetical protein
MQVAGSSTAAVQRPQSARCWPPDGLADQGRGTHRDLEYVEAFYNRRRPHSTLGMPAPLEYQNRTRMTGGTSLAASRLASTNKIGLQDNVNGQRRLILRRAGTRPLAALNHRRPSRNPASLLNGRHGLRNCIEPNASVSASPPETLALDERRASSRADCSLSHCVTSGCGLGVPQGRCEC